MIFLKVIIKKFRRIKRYLVAIIKHLTFKRFFNLIYLEYQLIIGRSILKAYPWRLMIAPSSICQLHCPLCLIATNKIKRQPGIMSLDLYKKIIDQLSPYAFSVLLYNFGEPFLNKDLVKFVTYAKRANLDTTISTNLSLQISEKEIEEIINAGLDNLIVSLDGVNQLSYEKYRIGGDYNLVYKNLKLFIQKKKELKSKKPYIEWQFLVMKHNESKINEVKKMASEIGVDSLWLGDILQWERFWEDGQNKNEQFKNEWLPQNRKYRKEKNYKHDHLLGKCWWLWRMAIINADGGVSSCCYVNDQPEDFGKINGKSFFEVWNNEKFVSARQMFNQEKSTSLNELCLKCPVYKEYKINYEIKK